MVPRDLAIDAMAWFVFELIFQKAPFMLTLQATGLQYYHIAQLLLALHNPTTPTPAAGLEYTRAHSDLEVSNPTRLLLPAHPLTRPEQKTVLFHARAICGIAHSNDFPTCRFTACPMMYSCELKIS